MKTSTDFGTFKTNIRPDLVNIKLIRPLNKYTLSGYSDKTLIQFIGKLLI